MAAVRRPGARGCLAETACVRDRHRGRRTPDAADIHAKLLHWSRRLACHRDALVTDRDCRCVGDRARHDCCAQPGRCGDAPRAADRLPPDRHDPARSVDARRRVAACRWGDRHASDHCGDGRRVDGPGTGAHCAVGHSRGRHVGDRRKDGRRAADRRAGGPGMNVHRVAGRRSRARRAGDRTSDDQISVARDRLRPIAPDDPPLLDRIWVAQAPADQTLADRISDDRCARRVPYLRRDQTRGAGDRHPCGSRRRALLRRGACRQICVRRIAPRQNACPRPGHRDPRRAAHHHVPCERRDHRPCGVASGRRRRHLACRRRQNACRAAARRGPGRHRVAGPCGLCRHLLASKFSI